MLLITRLLYQKIYSKIYNQIESKCVRVATIKHNLVIVVVVVPAVVDRSATKYIENGWIWPLVEVTLIIINSKMTKLMMMMTVIIITLDGYFVWFWYVVLAL